MLGNKAVDDGYAEIGASNAKALAHAGCGQQFLDPLEDCLNGIPICCMDRNPLFRLERY